MALYRCAACGSPNVVADVQKEGYDFVKGAIGTVALGSVGAVAGLDGKKATVYKCPDCGLTLSYAMPETLKAVIDLGLSNEALHEHLKMDGVPVDWNVLKRQYVNIGEVRTSAVTQLEKDMQAAAVANKANASKEEFDAAVDFIYDTRRKFGYYGKKKGITDYYCKETPFKLEDYIRYNSSVTIFVENCMKYIPPRSNLLINYRGLNPEIDIATLFKEYLLLKYEELTREKGMALSFCGTYATNDFLDNMIDGNMFLRSFIKDYSSGGPSRSSLIYSSNGESAVQAGRYAEGIFGQWNSNGGQTHLSTMCFIGGICVYLYFPKYIIKNSKLHQNTYLNSYGYQSEYTCEIKLQIEEYCAAKGLDKQTIYNRFAELKAKADAISERATSLETRNKQIEDKLLPPLRAERDELLRPRLFGRAKASQKAVPICNKIEELKKEIRDNKQRCEELSKDYAVVDKLVRKAICEFDFFQVWEEL